MSLGSYYRGTTHEQDARFQNKDKKILESMKFPKEFDIRVNINKVELKVIKQWVEKKINEILGFEDDVCSNYIISMLENKNEELDPKKMQMYLTGFLDNKASAFMTELWVLLISAQNSENGIPEEIIKEKKEEMRMKTELKMDKLKFLEKMLDKKESPEIKNYNEIKIDIINKHSRIKCNSDIRKYSSSDSFSSSSSSSSSDKRKNKKRRRNKSKSRSRNKKGTNHLIKDNKKLKESKQKFSIKNGK